MCHLTMMFTSVCAPWASPISLNVSMTWEGENEDILKSQEQSFCECSGENILGISISGTMFDGTQSI